jgi:hypothetical protein
VLVDDVRLEAREDHWELSGRVTMDRFDTEDLRIWFRFPGEYSTGELDASPFLPGLLVTAMWWNETLVIDGPVSARLIANVEEVTAMYRCLFPSLPAIGVSAPSHESAHGTAATACLFSRGVDSWYSVLKNLERPDPRRPPLTHLVYVPSIDFMYGDENRARSIDATRRAAIDVGCELILLETNLRHFTERFQEWGVTFGGGLAGIGLALGGAFSHLLLPSSLPIGAPNTYGSQPALDPLWSTERTTIVHDGAESSRARKVRYLADHPAALRNLKVCYDADTDDNCGKCGKCLNTMMALHAAGVLDAGPRFDVRLSPWRVARIPLKGQRRLLLRDLLEELDDDSRLTRRLVTAIEWRLLSDEMRQVAARMRTLLSRHVRRSERART